MSALDELLEDLVEFPDRVKQEDVWECLELALEGLSVEAQLKVAANTIEQVAQVLDRRMQQFVQDWEDKTNPEGPAVQQDIFANVVRSHMELDLSHLKLEAEPIPARERRKREKREQAEPSIAGPVGKEQVLEMIEEIELEEENLQAQLAQFAGGEEIEKWRGTIAMGIDETGLPVNLIMLRNALNMPLVEVWLGLLLGGYCLERSPSEDFYATEGVMIAGLPG
ncbi:MAG: hypothetical protein SFW36_04370 [Leptolyngbyaceae cyanobacterium bins.59]|nr:hypothetical protein [Leptolyngbyaceae cyanobacterium bins.59]